MRQLTKKEKIYAGVASALILITGAVSIYLLNKEDVPGKTEENNKDSPETNLPEVEQNSTKDDDNEHDNSSKPPKPRSRDTTPVRKEFVTNNMSEEESNKFLENVKSLLEDPEAPQAAKTAQEAKNAFEKAKSLSKESPYYHESLEYSSLETYLKKTIEDELIKTHPDENVLKAVKALRLLNPEEPLTFSHRNSMKEIKDAFDKTHDKKDEVRRIARKAALKLLNNDFSRSDMYKSVVDPKILVQFTPEEIQRYLEKYQASLKKQKNDSAPKTHFPKRQRSTYVANFNLLLNMVHLSHLNSNEAWREWAESGLKYYGNGKFQKFIRSDLTIEDKHDGLTAGYLFHDFSNPDLVEMTITPEQHLDKMISYFTELVIGEHRRNPGSTNGAEISQFIADFSWVKSEEVADRISKKIAANPLWKEWAIDAIKFLKVDNVTPNYYYKLIKLKLEEA